MAVINLKIQPDKQSLNATINEINQSLKKIEGVKLTIDQSGARAAQSLAAELQKAANSGEGLSQVIQKTETRVDKALTQTTEKVKKSTGEYVQTIKQFGKDSEKIAEHTTEVFIHNEQEKTQEAEKAERERVKAAEKAEREKNKLKLQIARDTRKAEEQEEKEKENAILKQAEAANRQLVKDEEEAQRRRTAAWKGYFDEVNKGIAADEKANRERERAKDTAVSLEKAYSDLIRQIQTLKGQYPEGTFDAIEQQAREAREELRNLDSTTEDYVQNVQASGQALQGYKRDLANAQEGTQKLEKDTESFGLTLQRIFKWFVGGRLLSKLTSEIREALDTMKDVDSALVTVQKTTGYTEEQIDALTESAYQLASAYGRTASEILDAASVYARAGFKDNLEDMTELSALLQNVGDLTGETAAKFLVATNAAWKMNGSYDALLRVIDGLNMQTNQAAVDMEALTSGITVAGSVFAGAGESVQTFAGLLGAGVATTQRSGAEIARGLRTILMNVRQIKGELEDGEIVDEESISDAAKALSSVGISVADANGELRLTSDVLKELAGKWGSLTTAEQSYLAQSLAGKRQANVLAALMQNWEEAQRQMTLYANGAGSAMQENEIYLNSWEAKTKQLSAAWTEFVSHLIDTGTIKRALDAIIHLVDILDTDLGRAALKTGAMAIVFGKLADGVAGTVRSFAGLVPLVTQIAHGLSTAALSTGGMVSIIVGATAATIGMYNALTTTEEEYEQAARESASAYEAAKTEYDNLIAKSGELTESEKSRLEVLSQQLSVLQRQANPNNYQAYMSKYDPTDPAKNAAEVATQLQRDYNYQLQMARDPANGLQRNVWIANAEETKQKVYEMRDELQKYLDVLGSDFPESGKYALNTLNDLINGWEAEEKQKKKDTEAWLEAGRAAFAWMLETKDAVEETVSLRDKLQAISQTATTYDEAIGGVVEAMDKFGAGSFEVYQAMEALEKAIPGSTDKIYDFDTATLTTKEDIFGSKDALLDFIDTTKQLEFSNAIRELEALAASYWDVAGAALAAMNAEAAQQMGGVLGFTTSNGYGSQIEEIRQQEAEWNAFMATLRARSDYRSTDIENKDLDKDPERSIGSTSDPELERLKAIVSLHKAELSFLQASGKSLDEINAKRREIQAALHDQAEYMRSIEADEEDILALSTEWWNIQKNINDDLSKAEEERLKQLEEEQKLLEEQKKLRQEMFDTLKKTVDEYYAKLISDKEEELSLEEKILAVQKAEADLANAQKERTVRYYNAATGQWEWAANAKTVKSAQDALKKAQDDLNKYQRDQAWKEFKAAWEYVSDQIKSGAMTFQEAYDYMYAAMKGIQDKYGVDLGLTLEDSIGGFKTLNYGIDGLTKEVADSLGASVGVLSERLKEYETAVGALQKVFDEVSEKVKNGEMSMEDAYGYLRDRAKEIADKYGIDMTGALEEAIAGMDKTNMSIDELWKAVIINLMKVNSARWFDANDEEKALLHAQNEYLGNLIGATYDPAGYWYLNGSQLYGSQKGAEYDATGYGSRTGSGGGYGIAEAEAAAEGVTTDGRVFYDSYGNTYPTLEEAVAGNAANSGAGGQPEGWWHLWQAGPLVTGEAASHASPSYADRGLHGYFQSSDGTIYNYDTAPDDVLARHGMVRGGDGVVELAPTARPEGLSTHMSQVGSLREAKRSASPEDQAAMRSQYDALLSFRDSDLGMTSGGNYLGGDTITSNISGGTVNQYYGNTYNFGSISMDEGRAKSTTVFELAELSRTLGNYGAR